MGNADPRVDPARCPEVSLRRSTRHSRVGRANRSVRVLVVALIAASAACKPRNVVEDPWTRGPWSTLPDGSSLREEVMNKDGVSYRDLTRCWPQGVGFSCIRASHVVTAMGDMTRLHRAEMADLEADSVTSQYSCTMGSATGPAALSEELSRGGERLTSNDISPEYGNARWSRSFVVNFLRDNGLPSARAHFDCETVADAIKGGSLASLGTTLVTAEVLE